MDENGRELRFFNDVQKKGETVEYLGGATAHYKDTNEKKGGNICFIAGIKCFAQEHKFGGVVIQPYKGKNA